MIASWLWRASIWVAIHLLDVPPEQADRYVWDYISRG